MRWGRETQNAVSKYPVAVSNQSQRAARNDAKRAFRLCRMGEKQMSMSKSYRLLGVMLVTATIAYLALKIGALSWGEVIAIVAVANLGLQMMAGMNILKWSDDI
jgi:hypothetical protein